MTKPKTISNLSLAGLLLFVAGFVVFMGVITAESYYPAGYSTSTNEISDLGSTRPPNYVIYQPSATIFNLSMVLTGILILGATYCLAKEKTRKLFLIPLGIFGIGVLGIGVFPGNTTPHPYFAILTFVSAGISAITSAKIIHGPYKYVAIALGSVGLFTLFFSNLFIPYLGDGGTERWIAYPQTLWMIGMGGYLLGSANNKLSTKNDT